VTSRIITLLSDFGLRDPYVAEMKAVVTAISADARIIDISHLIEKFNIRMGAFVLASAASYFPEGTIHVAVVDPGVGTKRRPLLLETRNALFIGPDNGLLIPAAQRDGIQHAYAITNSKLMLPKVSFTFHGRDVFAPAAAHLVNGTLPANFGDEISDYVVPSFARLELKAGQLRGEVLHIDEFGNIISNITSTDLERAGVRTRSTLFLRLHNKAHRTLFVETYGDVSAKSALALVGSHGFLEFAINQGNASRVLKAKAADPVTVTLQRN